MEETPTPKRFEITSGGRPYQPAEQPAPTFRLRKDLSSDFEQRVIDGHRLYLTEKAMNQMAGHIGWGAYTEANRVEQGGLLLGHAYRDVPDGSTYGVVSVAVASRSARGSYAHLEMSHQSWKEMLEAADELMAQRHQSGLQVIGWYHTHPDTIPVFMSNTDLETHKRLFAHDWQFAMVLNPQRQTWRAFHGAEATECRGLVIADDPPSQAAHFPHPAGVAAEGAPPVGSVEAGTSPRAAPTFPDALLSSEPSPKLMLALGLLLLAVEVGVLNLQLCALLLRLSR